MHRTITTVLAALALCAAALLPAGAGTAAPAHSSSAPTIHGQAPSPTGPSLSAPPAATATPTDSSSPAGPVDPGTGETRDAKEARTDYAPYVIGAILVIVLIGAWFLWRYRRNKSFM